MNIVKEHNKLHTIFVTSSITIPHIQVVVDDADYEQPDIISIFDKLVENKEFINGIDAANKNDHYNLLTLAYFEDFESSTFPMITTMIELGANPNIWEPDQCLYDPWRPYYPNPNDHWSSFYKNPELNLVSRVYNTFL